MTSDVTEHSSGKDTEMRKLVVKEWMTLDGIIDAESMDQWFVPYDSPERRAHIKEGLERSDAYLLGRVTYEMLAPYWSALPDEAEGGLAGLLNHLHKYVVSSSLARADWEPSSIIRDDVVGAISQLKQQPGKDILIDGSATLVRSLMATDLIDEYHLLVQPMVMGTGKRLFTQEAPSSRLTLIASEHLSKGVLALTYQPDHR
jgi:dihydrofolate reductase